MWSSLCKIISIDPVGSAKDIVIPKQESINEKRLDTTPEQKQDKKEV